MTQETVFGQQTPAGETSPAPAVTLPPEVTEFVGTGKKYADVNVALQSIPHAQKHISTLEAELQAAKDELAKRRAAEELVEELRKNGLPASSQPAPENPLSPEVVAQMVSQTIERREAETVAKTNISKVTSAFYQAHGKEHAEAKFVELAQSSGMSVASLNRLAAEAPAVVLRLAGLDKAPTPSTVHLSSGVNTEGFQQKPAELSARVGKATSTKDFVQAWRNAGEKIKQQAKE